MHSQTTTKKRRSTPGITARHARSCPTYTDRDATCRCKPTYRAWVFDRRSGSKIYKAFPTHAAAKVWRSDAVGMARRGALARPTQRTVQQAGDEWIEKAEAGKRRNRSGQVYKPSVLRSYKSDLRLHIYPDLGAAKLSDLRRRDVQDLVDRLVGEGFSGSKVRNAIMPLRVMVRDALEHDELIANPLANLRLPAVGDPRQRAASPTEAAELLAALPADVRAVYASAFYAGLRRGELRGLRVGDVDLQAKTITVARSWDSKAGEIDPKSKAGSRTVFLLDALAPELKPLLDRPVDAPLFGAVPFEPKNLTRKAMTAWAVAAVGAFLQGRSANVDPIGLHECRHTFSTFLDHAGVSESRADRYMGHSDGTVANRYRHLLSAQLEEDRKRVDAYVAGVKSGKVVGIAAA
jgi:integrase